MKIAENVYMLEIPYPYDGTIYPSLIKHSGGLALIDAGDPGMTGAFVTAIRDEGFGADELTEIILTHQDRDHIGCVKELKQIAPSAVVIAHTEEAPYIDGRRMNAKMAARLKEYDSYTDERKSELDRKLAIAASLAVSVDREVTDGEKILEGITVIHTPGHTPGHMCLFLPDSRIVIGGDALGVANGKLVGPNPIHSLDMELARQSLEKIKSCAPLSIVAYHGGYFELNDNK